MSLSIRRSAQHSRPSRVPASGRVPSHASEEAEIDVVQTRLTENQGLIQALQASSSAAHREMVTIREDYLDRTEALRAIAKECRELRLVIIYAARGEVTGADRAQNRPPRLRGRADGGVEEVLDYVLKTLRAARRDIVEQASSARATNTAVGESNSRWGDVEAMVGEMRSRDEDEITIISNWNGN